MASAVGGSSALELTGPDSTAQPSSLGGGVEAELSAVLREVLGIADAPAEANFFTDLGADSMLMAQFCARVRKHGNLPKVSMKDVYANPTLRQLATALPVPATVSPAPAMAPAAPATVEAQLALVLSEVLGIADAPAEANFFTDLGADSMLMAQFCARVRKHGNLPRVSMKDLYANPTLRELAAALPVVVAPAAAVAAGTAHRSAVPAVSPAAPTEPPTGPGAPAAPAPQSAPARRRARGPLAMWLCGLAQLVVLLVPVFATGLVGAAGFETIDPATGLLANLLRTVEFSAALVAAAFVLPVAAKWLLIGRFKVEEIPVWSVRYLRFWTVKLLLTRNPMLRMLPGSPLYAGYLRLLGARVGHGTTILTRHFPICTDLLTIGAHSVIRRDALLFGYHAHSGVIRTGRVTIGSDAVVGTRSVLDIDTAIGDRGQLGHASSLHPGQRVPAGQRWYGSPAAPGDTDFTEVPPVSSSRLRRGRFAAWQLLNTALITTPSVIALGVGSSVATQHLTGVSRWGRGSLVSATFYLRALGAAGALLLTLVLVGLPVLYGCSRLLGGLLRPGRVYRMHGVHHTALRTVQRITNYRFPSALTGDCALVVHHLGALGWRLKPLRQTGTNFGMTINQETPTAVAVGTGTVVADGLLVSNVEFSRSSFRVTPTRIGAENFLGNMITYPAASRAGDNCLLATKVMVPIDGPVRHDVGLLGSPSFPIPRTVNRDHQLAVTDPASVHRQLAAKTRHNAVTIALYLAVRWIYLFILLVWAEGAGEAYRSYGLLAMSATTVAFALATLCYFVLIERSIDFLCALVPTGVSIYDRAFWRHERYWKLPSHPYPALFNGTPWKPLIWRGLGVRMGRRVFDDGVSFLEKSFATVGDDVTLNMLAIVQCHSQEDGAFKSDRITIGPSVTLGVGAFVHYGVTMGQNSELAADSFLMKGEEIPADTHWGGNPARETSGSSWDATTLVGDI